MNLSLKQLAATVGREPIKLDWYMSHFFGHCKDLLCDARVLDVGAGEGLVSFCAACYGAKEVVSLEPEAAGSHGGESLTYERVRTSLGLDRCRLVRQDFMTCDVDSPFDVVIMHNSINHIREVSTDVRRDPTARELQRHVIVRMHDLLRPGGWCVISDCSRRNFFADIGVRSPVQNVQGINWRSHQVPGAWQDLLADTGMHNFSRAHYVPHKTRWLAPIVDSRWFSYATFSWFVLRAQRRT